MQKQAWTCCGTVGICAAFGIFARWLQNINIYEKGTGLAVAGAFTSKMLIFVCLMTAAALLYQVLRLRRQMQVKPETIIVPSSGRVLTVFMAISGLLAALGAGLILLQEDGGMLRTILALLGFLAAFGLALYPQALKHPEWGCVLCAAPVIFTCFWFIVYYKETAVDPVLWHFAPFILTLAVCILAFFYMAGFAFGKPRPFRAVFFALYAAFFCLTVLPDVHPLGEILLQLSFTLAFMTLAWHLVFALSAPQEAGETPEGSTPEEPAPE
ncbi:MAG: hypothetical protein Q4A39_00235, partial [Eubacteriales bacterium]|nr:hypothetical protein [Eubacteriales bacterium]